MLNEPNRLEVSAYLLDMRGKPCPLPIIELAKALRQHPRVELWADDPAAAGDLTIFVEATGHQALLVERAESLVRAVIVRPGAP